MIEYLTPTVGLHGMPRDAACPFRFRYDLKSILHFYGVCCRRRRMSTCTDGRMDACGMKLCD
jgi:hypothetical protein